jgi:hypothetical protein
LNSELSEGDAAADPTAVDVDFDGSLLEILSMVSGAVDARVDVGLLGIDIGWSGTALSYRFVPTPPARWPLGNVRTSLSSRTDVLGSICQASIDRTDSARPGK